VKAVGPDLIHIHWLQFALTQDEPLTRLGIPVTLRMHGFDVTRQTLCALLEKPWVSGVFAFPRQLALLPEPDERVKATPVAFETRLFPPAIEKDRRLVIRTGASLRSKDIGFFFAAAKRLPEFHFLFISVTAKNVETYVDELRDLAATMNSPVKLRFDVPRAETAETIGRAAIHLHTANPQGSANATPLGMPVSIAEGMATGAYTIARASPEFREYVGDARSTPTSTKPNG
jgi:glycosyltransferase involved in cell wall biosynthesis